MLAACLRREDAMHLFEQVVASRDALHGARDGDPRPRYPEWVFQAWVPIRSMAAPAESEQALSMMRAGRPVLLQETPLVRKLVGTWTLEHLVRSQRLQRT